MIITDVAQKKVAELIKGSQIAMPDYPLFLRVTVVPGGCSGLKHQTYFDYEKREEDTVYNYEGFDLRIDKLSSPYLNGSTIDYVESIDKIGFTLDNPNSEGSCACGDSFH
jgi:iron-sulfur cluster assembly accessory protein